MELLPNDIRQHTFRRGVRGYDREEVEQFLEHVAEALEDALNGRREAEDRVRRLKGEIERFKKMEESLKQAVVTAQSAMTKAQEASSQESESLKRAAQNEALSIVQEAESQKLKMEADIRYLQQLRENHVQQFRAFLNAQLTTLEQMGERPGSMADRTAEKPKAKVPAPTPEPRSEPEDPTWEKPSLSFAMDDPVAEPEEREDEQTVETNREPQPWRPVRIERTNDEEHEAASDEQHTHERVKPGDAGEPVVVFPPSLMPGDKKQGE